MVILHWMAEGRKGRREIDVTWPTTSLRPRAVTIGEGLAVLVARPGPLEDSENFERTAGGAEANVATALTQLDVDAGWISRVGDDGFGRYLTGHLAARGVDVSAVVIDPARPTAVYVKERGSGSGKATDLADGASRMLYYRTGSAASALSTADLTAAAGLLESTDLVHFTGITTALSDSATRLTETLVALPRRGKLVSFDLNYRPALWAGRVEQAAEVLARHVRGCDVVFLGADEAEAVFGTDDADRLRALFPEPEHLVVKNNEHSVTGFSGTERVEVPALELEITERIGAGDAFAGGYLAALLHGRPLEQRLRFGHLCAAAALTGTGDVAELPSPGALAALAILDESAWGRVHYSRDVVAENVAS
ncbi:sugar kinase [Nocardia pseudovaccinii]|uniref:sugar kinase n=1 Tax=Nocardia pseudovaccinii TaxID=189540 RepID=UPI001FE19239|nr:sugar kinase [Nocardia pseudovaccinii]